MCAWVGFHMWVHICFENSCRNWNVNLGGMPSENKHVSSLAQCYIPTKYHVPAEVCIGRCFMKWLINPTISVSQQVQSINKSLNEFQGCMPPENEYAGVSSHQHEWRNCVARQHRSVRVWSLYVKVTEGKNAAQARKCIANTQDSQCVALQAGALKTRHLLLCKT